MDSFKDIEILKCYFVSIGKNYSRFKQRRVSTFKAKNSKINSPWLQKPE